MTGIQAAFRSRWIVFEALETNLEIIGMKIYDVITMMTTMKMLEQKNLLIYKMSNLWLFAIILKTKAAEFLGAQVENVFVN